MKLRFREGQERLLGFSPAGLGLEFMDHTVRSDQLVHIPGFGVSTILVRHLIRPLLREPDCPPWCRLAFFALAWQNSRNRRILVTAAVIEKEGKVLLAQREPKDRLAGKWEFPGGKVEPGETPQDCLAREIREELGIEVQVGEFLCSSRFDYDHASVEILAYRCSWLAGQIQRNVHQALQWVFPEDLAKVDLAEADRPIARCLLRK